MLIETENQPLDVVDSAELTPTLTENYTIETTELVKAQWKHCIKLFVCFTEFRMLKSLSPVKAMTVG